MSNSLKVPFPNELTLNFSQNEWNQMNIFKLHLHGRELILFLNLAKHVVQSDEMKMKIIFEVFSSN